MAKPTWIRQWRDSQALTQKQAAARVRISRSRFTEIENGAEPSLSVAKRLAAMLGCEVTELHKRSPFKPSHPSSCTVSG